ncbi:MAG: leucine-rich repeat domain-containing protein [Candidatus Thorarchaeota archaeon]
MLEFQLFKTIFFPLVILSISIRNVNLRKEFKVNKYLKLKLEGGKTNIYVKNRRFMQCMYLLLNISVDRIEDYDEIESIDEAAIKLDRSMERDHNTVPPETEFWGHCSNLQAWAENGYDTRILHRNLAFPLLKRLSEVGDPLARKVFSEEIAIRLASKYPTVTQYLTQNGYLKYLSPDEFESILDDINSSALKDIIIELKYIFEHNQNIDLVPPINSLINRILRNFGIEHISLLTAKILKEIPENIRDIFVKNVYNLLKSRNKFPLIQYINKHLEYFKDFEFEYSFIKYNERIIGIFRNERVYLNNQNIQDLKNLSLTNNKFEEIKELDLSDNQIFDLKGIEKFTCVSILRLNNNKLSRIEGTESLKNLEKLFLRNNQIKEIRNIKNFNNLKHLDLSDNPTITEIPEGLHNLPKLETVKLWNCHINKFSKSTEKIFWMNQNYRYFTGFNENDKIFYESTYRRVASSDNKLYKHFVEWVLKMRRFMKLYKFSYQEINSYKEETSKNAIWSGRITKDFKKWLDDKKHQKKIISFI